MESWFIWTAGQSSEGNWGVLEEPGLGEGAGVGHVRTSWGPSTSYSKSYCFGSFEGTRPPAKGYEECGRIVCMCVKGALGGDLVSRRVWPSSLCPLPLFFLFEGLRLSGRFWVVDPDRKVKDWAHSGLLQQFIYRPPLPRPPKQLIWVTGGEVTCC